jgi:hypothetical protein
METHLVIALLVSWTTVFVALSKGIQSLGKVKIKTGFYSKIIPKQRDLKQLGFD